MFVSIVVAQFLDTQTSLVTEPIEKLSILNNYVQFDFAIEIFL